MDGLRPQGISRRRLPTLLLSGAASSVASTATAGAEQVVSARVVIHDGDQELEKVVHALENSINLSRHYAEHGQSVAIEVVFNGRAVDNFASTNRQVAEKIEQFSAQFPQVGLNLCGNSIKVLEQRTGKPFVTDKGCVIVPSGAVMLIEMQRKGWAYIRA